MSDLVLLDVPMLILEAVEATLPSETIEKLTCAEKEIISSFQRHNPNNNYLNLRKDNYLSDIDVIDDLQMIQFTCNITEETIQKILQLQIEKEPQNVITYMVLSLYIGWILLRNTKQQLNIVFQIITVALICAQRLHLVGKNKVLIHSIIYQLFDYIFKSKSIPTFEQVRSLLIQFFTTVENIEPEYANLFDNALKLILSDQPESISSENAALLTTVHALYTNKSGKISESLLKQICGTIAPPLFKLDISALTFFSMISSNLSYDTLEIAFTIFPTALYQFSISYFSLPELDFGEAEPMKEITFSPFFEVIFRFSHEDTNISELNMSVNFPERQRLTKILPPHLEVSCKLIGKALAVNPMYVEQFMNSFIVAINSQISNANLLSLVSLMIFMFTFIKPQKNYVPFYRYIFNSPLFDDRISIISQNSQYPLINSLRWEAFDMLIHDNGEPMIIELFELTRSKPLVFAEMVHRLLISNQYTILSEAKKYQLITTSLTCALSLQSQAEHSIRIKFARTSIMLLISRLFDTEEYMELFFREEYYTTIFVSFIFEARLRENTIRHIRLYLANVKVLSPCLADIIGNAFSISAISFPQQEALSLVNNLLECLNEVMQVRRTVANYLTPIRSTICDILIPLTKAKGNETAIDILVNAVQFFINSSNDTRTTSAELSSFNTATGVFDGEPPLKFFKKLIQLLSGQSLSTILPQFIVREPKFLTFFLSTYFNTGYFPKAVEYVDGLLDYARDNIIACHRGKVDQWLLNVLRQEKTSPEPNLEVVKNCINLFKKIDAHISSVTVVQDYISLFAPINASTVSDLQPVFINGMTETLRAATKNPQAIFPLIHGGTKFDITNIDGSILSDGCTFYTWVYGDSPVSKYTPHFFTLLDNQGKRITAMMKMDQVVVNVRGASQMSTGIVDDSFPFKKWVFMSFSIFNNAIAGGMVMRITFDLRSSYDLLFPKFVFGESVQCIVGGIESGEEPERPILMGSFGMIKGIAVSTIAEVEASGPRIISKNGHHIFVVVTKTVNSRLDYEGKAKFGASISHYGDRPLQNMSFADALVNICNVTSILPVFSQLDLVFANSGEPFDNCASIALDLLLTALQRNNFAQKSLADSEGIDVLAHLLISADAVHINYGLYTKFFSIIQNLSNFDLQSKIARFIMLNIAIWIRCEPNDHIMVIRHWQRILMPFLRAIQCPTLSFRELLDIMEIYYWENEIGKSAAQINNISRCRGISFDMRPVRKIFIEMVVETATSQGMTEEDLDLFMSHAISGTEGGLILDYLDAMTKLIIAQPSPLMKIPNRSQLLLVVYLMNCKSTRAVTKTMEVLLLLSNNAELGVTTAAEATEIVLHQINSEDAIDTSFDMLVGIVNAGFLAALNILSWMAVVLGQPFVEKTFSILEPKEGYASSISWPLWPLIAALIYPTEVPTIIQFLVQCGPKGWSNVYDNLALLHDIFNVDVSICYREFFFGISNQFLSGAINHKQSLFYSLALSYIFVHNSYESVLVKEFKSSVFGELESPFKERRLISLKELCFAPFDLYQKIESYQERRHVQISLRINDTNKWQDADIGALLLQVFVMLPNKDLLPVMFSLAHFLARFSPGSVTSLMSNIHSEEFTYLSQHNETLNFLPLLEKALASQFKFFYHQSGSMEICGFLKKCWKRTIEALGMASDRLVSLSPDSIAKTSLEGVIRASKSERAWRRLWRNLSSERGPWNFKGDFTYHMRRTAHQSRLKINWAFKDHLESAIKREESFGSEESLLRIKESLGRRNSSRQQLLEVDNAERVEIEMKASKIVKCDECTIISITKKTDAIFKLLKNGISLLCDNEPVPINIKGEHIRKVLPRKVDYVDTAIEIFLWTGKSFLLDFRHDPTDIIDALRSAGFPNVEKIIGVGEHESIGTEKWIQGELSNFEYLMRANEASGRTFNDLSQYPMLPWIIKNYKGATFDFKNPDNYRDLTRPASSIVETKKSPIKESATSSSEIASYLIRLEPFTTIRIEQNGGSFEEPSATFKSIEEEFGKVCKDINDKRELTPEFFAMPEFLMNFDGFELGDGIGDVELPEYAPTPMEFIYLHRKALESKIVSEKLNYWIDSVFGIGQDGKSTRSIHRNPYSSSSLKDLSRPPTKYLSTVHRSSNSVSCSDIGQISYIPPDQLFTEPHPKRWPSIPLLVETLTRSSARLDSPPLAGFLAPDRSVVILLKDKVAVGRWRQRSRGSAKSLGMALRNAQNKELDFSYKSLKTKVPKGALASETRNGFVVVAPGESKAMLISESGKISKLELDGEADSLSASDNLIAVGCSNAITYVYLRSLHQLCQAQCFKSSVKCVCVSQKYSIVVSGMADSQIVIAALDGSLTKVVPIHGKPLSIRITNGFGFIVVYSSILVSGKSLHYLTTFNVNGLFIRTTALQGAISMLTAVTNSAGFDFLLWAEETGKLCWAEAFTLELQKSFYRCSNPVRMLCYDHTEECAIVLTEDGSLLSIPRSFE